MTNIRVAAPVKGWLTSLDEVPDPVFAAGMLGAGVAIDPAEGLITAPFAAKVVLVAPTRHAVTLRTEEGAELVIHVGLETVALGGRGFQAHVQENTEVAAGDPLISFDLDLVGLDAKSLVTPVILANDSGFRFVSDEQGRMVERGEQIGTISTVASESAASPTPGPAETIKAVVGEEHGLHARPAARIVECAKRFAADVSIEAHGRTASARSAVALMALGVGKGEEVLVHARGPDSGAALQAVSDLIEHAPAARQPAASSNELPGSEIGGVCAVPGVAVGTAFHWRRKVQKPAEEAGDPALERQKLDRAIDQVRVQLAALSTGATGAAREIALAHMTLVDDEELRSTANGLIERGKSAGSAWVSAIEQASHRLNATENRRMQERVADLDDIAGQVLRALGGTEQASPVDLPERSILLARDLLPTELLALDRSRVAGICLAQAGPTSHSAIIAASFGVPTLVGTMQDLSQIPAGARVLLDATSGKLVANPSAEEERVAVAQWSTSLSDAAECLTADGQRITLLANLGSIADVEAAVSAGAEGCGLLRTEFLFLDRRDAPGEDEQHQAYQAIADALGERPLTIRTLDIGGDKPAPFLDLSSEENPALGMRGIRIALARPDLLNDQLRAILKVRSSAIVKVMIPMVSSLAELRAVRAQIGKLANGAAIRLGVMVETPAAAAIADRLAAEADFLSIGSNDLAQYALAMDRTNPALAGSVDALHPAVLRLIASTVEAADRQGTPVSLCGGLASDHLGAMILVGLGLRELSAPPASLPAVRGTIRHVTVEDCRRLADQALAADSAAETRKMAAELLAARRVKGSTK